MPDAYRDLPLEVHSAPSSDTDPASRRNAARRLVQTEDDQLGGSERIAKVVDRFHVKDVFQVSLEV